MASNQSKKTPWSLYITKSQMMMSAMLGALEALIEPF